MKRTMVYLTLFLLVTSAWAIDFRDDFEDGNMDEWTNWGCKWHIENGKLILESVGIECGFTIGETIWQDYTIGVKAKIAEHQVSPQTGERGVIVFRFNFPNMYVFGLGTAAGSDLKTASVWSAGAEGRKDKPFEWELNRWYDLRVTAKDNQFQFSIDGQVVLTYIDDKYPTGEVGLGVGINSTIVHFDDFFVTDEDIPSITAVSPKHRLAKTWSKIKRR